MTINRFVNRAFFENKYWNSFWVKARKGSRCFCLHFHRRLHDANPIAFGIIKGNV